MCVCLVVEGCWLVLYVCDLFDSSGRCGMLARAFVADCGLLLWWFWFICACLCRLGTVRLEVGCLPFGWFVCFGVGCWCVLRRFELL